MSLAVGRQELSARGNGRQGETGGRHYRQCAGRERPAQRAGRGTAQYARDRRGRGRPAPDVRRHAGHHRCRRPAGRGRRHPADGGARQRPSDLLRRRTRSPARALRPSSRRHGAVADQGLHRARPAAVRNLPRPAGDERGLRRHAASGDPRHPRPHEPSHAAAGERRDPSRSGSGVRRSPRGAAGNRWRLRQDAGPRFDPRELAARPGHPRAGRARRRRGHRRRRHDRGDPHRRRALLRPRRPVARRVRPPEQSHQPRPVPGLRQGARGEQEGG